MPSEPLLNNIERTLSQAEELLRIHPDTNQRDLQQARGKVQQAKEHVEDYKMNLREEYDDDAFA